MRFILDRLEEEVETLGKESWRPLLRYVAALHSRSIHPARHPLRREWEEIGPGYFSRAFGHWDIVHQVLDSLPVETGHAKNQIRNVLEVQAADGLLPGSLWFHEDSSAWNLKGYPPVWVAAIERICKAEGDLSFAAECFEPLRRSIAWYERNRKAEDGGFFYTFDACWESGVDEGLRFAKARPERIAAVDASCHVYWLYEHAAKWAEALGPGKAGTEYRSKAAALRELLQRRFFDEETGFFHDIWSVGRPELRVFSFEGFWPLAVGAATAEQATRVIEENLLNPERFFTPHPLATVALCDPGFEPRMWRGPAWNSMTLWAAYGCLRYGRAEAASALVERALDASAKQFERTGTIWEFYDSLGGEPEKLHRKPFSDKPCRDYLGHNPLISMARVWQEVNSKLHSTQVEED